MRIAYIEVAGFRGFRQRARVDVPAGFLVMCGRNGAGKSSLCDAVEFALTGTINKFVVEKGGREGVEDYIWWRGPGVAAEHFVKVGFTNGAGELLEVERSREQGLKGSLDGIEDALCDPALRPPNSLENLCKTSIIRDELIAALSLDLSDTARFDFVRSALGAIAPGDYISRVKQAIEAMTSMVVDRERAADGAASRLRIMLGELADAEALASRAADLETALSDIRGVLQAIDTPIGDLLPRARSFLAARRALLASASGLTQDFVALEQMRLRVLGDPFTRELEEAIANATAAAAKLREATQARVAADGRLRTQQSLNATSASLAALLSHGQSLGLKAGHCPLCSAARSDAEFAAALLNLQAQVDSLDASLRILEDEAQTARARDETASEELQAAEARRAQMIAARDLFVENERRVAASWKQITGAENVAVPTAAEAELYVTSQRDRLATVERHVFVLEASLTVDKIAQLQAAVSAAKDEVDTHGAAFTHAQTGLEKLTTIEKVIRRVNAEIVDERLAAISPLLSEFYYRLRPHTNWRQIDYRIRGDVRRFLSLQVGDELNPQFLFSSGQRRAAGLAFLLAVYFSRTWCNWQTLIVDDPIQHIDDFRALQLIEVLAAIRKANRQIICAVEDPALADVLCRRLRNLPESPGARIDLHYDSSGGGKVQERTSVDSIPAVALVPA